ncbi:ArnT family glycosyltransferase [Halopelagius longus]|uniref:Dolichyl-phosphate-mannose-protein mannosyltransferase n=1 Tax=Halopelagius longus TaxID=1236180 RepID=A0A1H1ANJ4_9EURY|nr:glycosyltransferase family 39 protein [Halopelagius longus]RDI70454.1 hypothetical protein DWB78_01250 [Halopelagius longus]SDQ41194.1 Dolichyl-phosphate-mannose-protein mannosyltransferase [Halopelagius longus]
MTRTDRLFDRPLLVLGALVVAFVGFRALLATQSSFGFHHGWNEGHYALIARGFLDHPLVPRYGTNYVYNVPPLYPYLVTALFALFGQSDFLARVPSILFGAATIAGTFYLGRVVFDERRGLIAGAVLSLFPLFQLYAGRAQTDITFVALYTWSLALITEGYVSEDGGYRSLVLGGITFALAFAAKQPAVLLPLTVVLWLLVRRRFDYEVLRKTAVLVLSSAVALVPLIAWFYVNYSMFPAEFVRTWEHELFARTEPFANVHLVVAIGLLLGVTPVPLALAGGSLVGWWKDRLRRSRFDGYLVLVLWVAIYGAFVLYRTPRGHQYYVTGLLPPIALLTADGILRARPLLRRVLRSVVPRDVGYRRAVVAALVLSTVCSSVVLFELSGEYSAVEGSGERLAPEVSAELASLPSNATILVTNEYHPPVRWYLRSETDITRVRSFHPDDMTTEKLDRIRRNSSGPVYLVYPKPTWEPLPTDDASVVAETSEYEFTTMSLPGRVISTESKFRYYLEDRQLVVYRLGEG